MRNLLLATLPVLAILLASEYLWRKKALKGERARKFIHILAGVWLAFWPFYLPFDGIVVVSAMMVTVLVYSRMTRLFHAIYAVKRKTYGDVLYAVSALLCAYFGQEPWIFTVSMLFLSLADGSAAVAGGHWGQHSQYYVFGKSYLRKSVVGTVTYLILAYISISVGWLVGGESVLREHLLLTVGVLPFLAMVLENITPFGIDNMTTPLMATLLLNSLL